MRPHANASSIFELYFMIGYQPIESSDHAYGMPIDSLRIAVFPNICLFLTRNCTELRNPYPHRGPHTLVYDNAKPLRFGINVSVYCPGILRVLHIEITKTKRSVFIFEHSY